MFEKELCKSKQKEKKEAKGCVFSLCGIRLSHVVDVLVKQSELSIVNNACLLNRDKVFLWRACMCHTPQNWIQYISEILCSLQQKFSEISVLDPPLHANPNFNYSPRHYSYS